MVPLIMAIRFISEVLALVIFGMWGFHHWKIIGVTAAPLMVAVIWSMWASPKAPYKLQGIYGFALEFVIFSAASYCLYSLGYTNLALIFLIVAIGVAAFMRFMGI
ncbi:YrdB family protein [Bacillus sp. AGMB 02131]|uniref:YrdB family protein n=1 Tax=Peribacillus faecalis TaxID=2772559 RepID=A0A927CZR0_9BACI|nr:YrdB family protein [Peribacillus faecalis]MBD3109632.1 YrdB family protein [Peribacillus faecalis]